MMLIQLPKPFSKKNLFHYLRRSKNEITFEIINDDALLKLFVLDTSKFLTKITFFEHSIEVHFINQQPSELQALHIETYITDWFDLKTNLNTFYDQIQNDDILGQVIIDLKGLRIVKCPNLFEALAWSIIGQQINLPFAYSCKKALVKRAGEQLVFEGKTYYCFPLPTRVLEISDIEFREMKFSNQKVKYIRTVAMAIANGNLSKQSLSLLTFENARTELVKLKGIGNWSANYTLMRCLGYKEAFPIEDVGLQNALKVILKKETKPTIQEIKKIASSWKGWEAYATFYLWQTLLK